MKLADTQAIAYLVRRPAATIRSWAHRGWLTRHGKDKQGRTLYNIDQAQQVARHIDNTPDVQQHKDGSRGSVP